MTTDSEFKDYVFDQMKRFGKFDTKNMFGGTALLRNGKAFAKIKHGSLWLKTDNGNLNDFLEQGMNQYAYGKDNSRTLNFYETPVEVLEDAETLIRWAAKACEAAGRAKK